MAVMSEDTRVRAEAVPARAWWTAVIYIAAVALFLRFYDLPLKPLHHDEGVNTLFLTKLVQPPHEYRYDPANYHGPTLYYLSWLSTMVFGVTTVAIRMVTATAGFLSVLLILVLRRHLGSVASLCAAALLALSPGAVYFSRYYIHEMLLVCFTLATVVFAWKWWTRGAVFLLTGAAGSAALMFATKETAFISAALLVAAGCGLPFLARISGRADTGAPRRLELSRPARRPSLPVVLLSAGVFVGVVLAFYTSLFSHWEGALDAVRTFAFWTKTGTSAHTRSWATYLRWLSIEEMPLLLFGLAGVVAALWRRDNPLALFAALWAIGTIAVYSAIPYKTPWLVLNMILPLAMTGGHACELMWNYSSGLLRAIGIAAFGLLLAFTAFQSVSLNFFEYDNDRYPYVYAHTDRDVLRLVDAIEAIEDRNPRSPIAVTSRVHFPLSWYLREYPSGYYGREVVTGDPLVIASTDQQPFFDRALGGRYQRRGVYRLRPGVSLVLYARRDLRQ